MNKIYKAALTVLLCATSVSGMDSPTITNPAVTANKYFQETTCFFDAIQDGNIDLVKQLLEENKELALRKSNGLNAIYLAILYGQTDIAKILYDKCPESIFSQNAQGEFVITSVLHLLNSYHNQKDYELIWYIISNPCTISQNFLTNQIKDQIPKIRSKEAAKTKESALQKLWIEENCTWGQAIQHGNIEVIKKYLDIDKELASIKLGNSTPLNNAILFKQIEAAKILCDVYPQGILEVYKDGKNYLGVAAERGLYDFVSYVLEKHQNIFTGDTLRDFINTYVNIDLMKYLIDKNILKVDLENALSKKIKESALQKLWREENCTFGQAIQHGNIEVIKKYLDIDKELASIKLGNSTPLNLAMLFKQIEAAKILCDVYPQCILEVYEDGQNYLDYAAEKGLYDFVSYVLEKHQNIFTDDSLRDFITTYGNVELMKHLIDKKILKVDLEDAFSKKIIDLQSFNTHVDVVKYFIDSDKKIKDYLFENYMKFYDVYRKIQPNSKFLFDKNNHKEILSAHYIANHMKEFGLNENDEVIIQTKIFIETLRKLEMECYRILSNHRLVIKYGNEGNQGAGVKVIVWDSFLTPPKDSEQIIYSSRLDHKIPLEARKSLFKKAVIERRLGEGSHGIHVAGLIADDDFGIAPKAQIIPMSKQGVAFQPLNEIADYILTEGYGAKIINMSFGSANTRTIDYTYLPVLKKLCQNHIVVKSAGNDGCAISRSFHQALEEDEFLRKHLFIVSNFLPYDKTLSTSSNYFSEQDSPDDLIESVGIAAPGDDIKSTAPENNLRQFISKSGTSMAAPIVSGAIAKVMSDFPDLSITEIADLVRSGAIKQGIFANRGKYGEGCLDLKKTYRLAELYVKDTQKGIPGILKDLNNGVYGDIQGEDEITYGKSIYGDEPQIFDPMQELEKAGDRAKPDHFRDVAYNFRKQNNYEQAAHYDILAIKKAGDKAKVYDFVYAYRALSNLGRQDEADVYMKHAVAKAEEKGKYSDFLRIAKAFYKTGQLEQSLLYAKQANQITDSKDEEPLLQMAKILIKIGNYDEAENYISLVISLATENAEAIDSDSDSSDNGSVNYILESIVKFLTEAGQIERAAKYQEMINKFDS